MKLAIVHPFQFRFARGIERATWSLAKALARRDVAVDLLTWRWTEPVSWGEAPVGVRILEVPDVRYFRKWTAIPYYLFWLGRGGYDWVLTYFAGYGEAEALGLLRRIRPQRYCVVFHFPLEQVPHRYAEFDRFDIARRADQLVAVSEYVAEGVRARFGRMPAVIGNGVEMDAFQPSPSARAAARERLSVAPDAPMLVSLAALEERKGMQWVIRALPQVLAEFPGVTYWVVGEGQHRAPLEEEIMRLRLEACVRMVGNCDDVFPYLAAADVGCLLSRGEAFGIAVMEYMAMELPVLTSFHPPFPELVKPAWGAMVDEPDAGAVARALCELLRDPARRRAMGAAGRRHVVAHHTWEIVADRYLRLLNGAAAGASP